MMLAWMLAISAVSAPETIAAVVRVIGPPRESVDERELLMGADRACRFLVGMVHLPTSELRLDADDEIRRCGEDNACVAAQLRRRGVQRGVYVVANLLVEPPLVTVEVLDTDPYAVLSRELLDSDAAPLEAAIHRSVERALVAAGHVIGGALLVEVSPAGAAIQVEGSPVSLRSGVLVVLTPGRHRLRAELEGYEAWSGEVRIEHRETMKLSVELAEVPGIASKWWFWVTLGLVVAGGVAIGAVAATRPGTVDVCHPTGGGPC